MRQGPTHSQRLEAGASLRVDPRLVLAGSLLQLSGQELEQALESELVQNPALERLDAPDEVTEDEVFKTVAPQELQATGDSWESKRSISAEGETSWLDLIASNDTLEDHLVASLAACLPDRLHQLAEWVVGCLDERGYLSTPAEEIALDFGCSIEEAELAIDALRRCDPPGIGARDVKDCLLLQLRGGGELERKLARLIVRDHLEGFAARRVSYLSRRFRVLPSAVQAAFDLIVSLTPFPAESYMRVAVAGERSRGVVPDLLFGRTEQGWIVEVTGLGSASLAVNRYYAERLERLRGRSARADRDERAHLGLYVQRARDFIAGLEQRRETMTKIGRYLVEHQDAFLSTGDYGFLRPLTKAKMAAGIGLHESTVSRATADKFVQLPNGELAPFDVFFKPALRVQRMIEHILQTENPGAPLSDERIAAMLAARGVDVARRTVNKYRDRTRLLSSRGRRVA